MNHIFYYMCDSFSGIISIYAHMNATFACLKVLIVLADRFLYLLCSQLLPSFYQSPDLPPLLSLSIVSSLPILSPPRSSLFRLYPFLYPYFLSFPFTRPWQYTNYNVFTFYLSTHLGTISSIVVKIF